MYKIAFLEMMWIYLAKSNDVRWLNERGSKLWNYWAVEPDGYYRIYGDKEKETIIEET